MVRIPCIPKSLLLRHLEPRSRLFIQQPATVHGASLAKPPAFPLGGRIAFVAAEAPGAGEGHLRLKPAAAPWHDTPQPVSSVGQ